MKLRTIGVGKRYLGLVLCVVCGVAGAAQEDDYLPRLETKTGVYSNVTVTLKTAEGVHIRHAGGIGNINLADLSEETRAALGYQVTPKEMAAEQGVLKGLPGKWRSAIERLRQPGEAETGEAETPVPIELPPMVSGGFLAVVLLVGLFFHLFFSYCSRLICLKAGSDPGFLVWLPVLQIFPMFRAAGMSGWWVLGLFVPVLNLVVQVLWCIKIVGARGKHFIWAIFLILPVLNLVAFLYLAFSNGERSSDSVGFSAYSPRPA